MAIFAGNDFGDLVRNKLYRLNDSGALLENNYSVSTELRRNMELNRKEPILKKIARDAWRSVLVGDPTPYASGERDPKASMIRALEQNLQNSNISCMSVVTG
ncbi:MAG: hypothetical protein JJU27_19455 [Gammaproteobacteria bacterium]|nr:hypothetical protein [Gammaproteobacteria bacterium]